MNANNQNNAPPTQLSASVSAESTQTGLELLKGAQIIDELFPLFTVIFQQIDLPHEIVFPFLVFFFCQVIAVSLWPWNAYWIEHDENHLIEYLQYALFGVPKDVDSNVIMINSVIVFALNLISFILIRFQLAYYKVQRSFLKVVNFPIRFYCDTILLIIIVPTVVAFGESFLNVAFGTVKPQFIISMILGVVSLSYEMFSFIIMQSFASKSISISKSLLLTFDPSVMIICIPSLILIIILYFILALFESWARLFAIFIHAALYIYLAVYIFWRIPFVEVISTALSVAWCFGNIFGDFLMIISEFYRNINHWFFIGLVYGTFLIGAPPILIYFIWKIKKIVSVLNIDIKNDEEAYEYYRGHGLEKNKTKALLYLRIAFQKNCPCFYNWTLVKFIADTYTTEDALSTCLHFVHFFPKENHLINRLRRQILATRKISFSTRFLIYQIDTIKTLRNFTVTSSSKLKLIELKTMSKQCEMMTRQALDSAKLTPNYFESLSHKAHITHMIWKEALENSPNNPKLCEEFTRYLVECETDFISAIRIKRRGQVIEMGHNLSVDYSFRSMVRTFPNYLTKGIVDFNGAIATYKKQQNKTSGSVSSNNNASQSSNEACGIEDELDNDVEEYVGKQTLTDSKTRLALQRALETKIPISINLIVPTAIAILIFVLIIFVSGFSFSIWVLSGQTSSMTRLDCISQTRFYIALSDVDLILRYCEEHDELQKYIDEMRSLMRSTDPVYINVLDNMLREMILFTNNASTKFQELIENIADLALEGEDVRSWASSLLEPTKPIVVCGLPTGPSKLYQGSMSSIISMTLSHQREFAGMDSVYNLMKMPNYCEIFLNFKTLYREATKLFADVCNYQQNKSQKLLKIFHYLSIIIPVLTFCAVVIPVIVIHIMTIYSIKQVIKIINSLDAKSKNDAKQLITIQATDDDSKAPEVHDTSRTSAILITIICFLSFSFFAVSFTLCVLVVKSNKDIIKLNNWNEYACLRLSLSAESLIFLIFSVAMHDIPESRVYGTIDDLVNASLEITKQLVQADLNLTVGTEESPACSGFDEILDKYNIIDGPTKPKIGDPHDFYAVTSIHQQIDIYSHYVQALAQEVKHDNKTVSKFIMANSIHVVNAHLWMRMMNVTKRLITLAEIEYTDLCQSIMIMAVIVVVLMISFAAVVTFYYNNRINTYKASLSVLRRFHPMALINNKLFARHFLKSKDMDIDDKLSVEGSIIHNANDAIFCTSCYGVVETVNKSVQMLLGYTPEQILGQHVSSFFSAQDEEKIQSKIDMMKAGQSSTYIEDDFTAITDLAKAVPCHVTIIGMKSNNEINSFVVILRDQTELVKQMAQAEEAKAKSEKLLYQILPRDIVVQLNRGEKDITFTVNSATIMFIDIVKFSEYTANLSPQEIMSNLSLYFAGIDKIATKYPMITKIKLIGDIYMAAAGLFNPDSPPEQHAEQSIQLALDALAELDTINVNLEASLAIRIGVNSGGPIIAGVLGTDKPAFDIIGDPINVAARLQSTDEPNHVHISQATYDLIKSMNFDVQKRGETFLKGKGKQMTYFVNPTPSFFSATNSFVRH